jgi:hypothetical protein
MPHSCLCFLARARAPAASPSSRRHPGCPRGGGRTQLGYVRRLGGKLQTLSASAAILTNDDALTRHHSTAALPSTQDERPGTIFDYYLPQWKRRLWTTPEGRVVSRSTNYHHLQTTPAHAPKAAAANIPQTPLLCPLRKALPPITTPTRATNVHARWPLRCPRTSRSGRDANRCIHCAKFMQGRGGKWRTIKPRSCGG